MPIPDFQSTMLPLLEFCKDEQEHSNHEALTALATLFKLTDEEKTKLLPSGNQRVFDNRIAWARSHMRRAGLIENTGRGVFRITARGKAELTKRPEKINIRFLQQFPDYVNWRSKAAQQEEIEPAIADPSTSPTEQLEDAYEVLRESLADDLLTKLKSCSPAFFEKVVVEVLVKMGYGGSRKDAGQAIGKVGDERHRRNHQGRSSRT